MKLQAKDKTTAPITLRQYLASIGKWTPIRIFTDRGEIIRTSVDDDGVIEIDEKDYPPRELDKITINLMDTIIASIEWVTGRAHANVVYIYLTNDVIVNYFADQPIIQSMYDDGLTYNDHQKMINDKLQSDAIEMTWGDAEDTTRNGGL